jgi:hypothetical protein
MTLEFLLFANVVLLARLFCLFKDEPVAGGTWVAKSILELVVYALLFRWTTISLLGALVAVGANLISWRWETRPGRRNLRRLFVGLAELLLLSVLFAPVAGGIEFHAALRQSASSWSSFTLFGGLLTLAGAPGFQMALLGLLLAANESNLAIRAGFDRLDLKPRLPADGNRLQIDDGEFNRGRIIGILERVLLYIFLFQGHLGAIGFVLAAKAFTRFKALDDRSFAEYVLIGTLLSACFALLCAWSVKLMLAAQP